MQKLMTHLLRLPVAFFDRRRRGDLIESVRHDVSKTRAALRSSIVDAGGAGAQAYRVHRPRCGSALGWCCSPCRSCCSLPRRQVVRGPETRAAVAADAAGTVTASPICCCSCFRGSAWSRSTRAKSWRPATVIDDGPPLLQRAVAAARIKGARRRRPRDGRAASASSLVIVVGGFEVIAWRLSMPSLVAVLVAIRAMHGPLQPGLRSVHGGPDQLGLARDACIRCCDTEPELRDRPDAIALVGAVPSLRFEHVSFGYGTGRRAC